MTYDLIIFDYDGVVADSEVLNSTVMAEQLTAIGLPTSLDDVLAAYTGKRWRDNRPVVEAALGRACPDDFHTTWFATCRQRAPQQLEPVPGLLDFVAARPEPRCIATQVTRHARDIQANTQTLPPREAKGTMTQVPLAIVMTQPNAKATPTSQGCLLV